MMVSRMDSPNAAPPQVTDEEIAATSPTGMIRATAGFQIGSGVLTALVAVQLLSAVVYRGPIKIAPVLMLAFGIAGVPVGANVFRMRLWAAQAGVLISGIVGALQGLVFVFNLSNGLLSCLRLISPALAVLSFVFSFFAVPPCARATAIRKRMREAGLDLGN